MEYTGSIPTFTDYVNEAKKQADKYKETLPKMKVWSANDLFYEEVNYYSKDILWEHDMGLHVARLRGECTFSKRVPDMYLEFPVGTPKSEVIRRFCNHGYDKYKLK